MELEFWAQTDVGRVRDHNEDNFLVDKRANLFVVCDGMGGHAAGEVASAMSVRVVREVVSSHPEVFERLENDPDDTDARDAVLDLLELAIKEACSRIYQAAQENPSQRGMGTTCCLITLAHGRGFVGHVGDSRIYLHRGGRITQVTEDHSLVNEMLRLGKIKPGEEHRLPHKNAVTRAVGVNESVEVDTFEVEVEEGDTFLLCSDGLSGYFKNDDQIAGIMGLDSVKEATERAIAFANSGGGKDNITAILIRVAGSRAPKSVDLQAHIDVMRAAPYFQYLAYKELAQLVEQCEHQEFKAGETIFAQGTDPARLFMIVRGAATVMRNGNGVGSLEVGDHFGETSVIDETPQAVGVVAREDCVLLALERERFVELLRVEPNLAVKLLWNFVQTFAIRLREVPYETFLQPEGVEATPPSGTLVFEEDRKDSAERAKPVPEEKTQLRRTAVNAAAAADSQAKRTPSKSAAPKAASAAEPAGSPPQQATTAPDAATIPEGGASMGSSSSSFGDDLQWDEIVPPDILAEFNSEPEEDLRRTVPIDQDEIPSEKTLRSHDALGKTGPMQPADDGRTAIGKGISGESVVNAAPPRAQVLKRTKLIVGDESFTRKVLEASADEDTREMTGLKERSSEVDAQNKE